VASLKVQLVAADRKVWEGEATMVSARSVDGELGVMADHQPLLTVLADGEVRIKTAAGTHTAHVDSGFLSVDHNVVTIIGENVDASGLNA
jgi:F-type H+-transporting ATPase subunit epsilon